MIKPLFYFPHYIMTGKIKSETNHKIFIKKSGCFSGKSRKLRTFYKFSRSSDIYHKLLNVNGSSASDIHRINILTSYILCHILHIFLCILNWKDTHDNTCKTTAMNSADTCSDLIQEQLGKRQAECDLLFLTVLQGITVLQPLPGRIARLLKETKESSPSLFSTAFTASATRLFSS